MAGVLGKVFTSQILGYALGVTVILLALSGMHTCSVKKDLKVAKADVETITTSRDSFKAEVETQKGNVQAEKDAHKITKASLDRVRGELDACQDIQAGRRDAANAASNRLDQRLAVVMRNADAAKARYEAALDDAECAICIDRPICPALRRK